MAFFLSLGPAIGQDKASEEEVVNFRALLKEQQLSDSQMDNMVERFRVMPKLQRDNMMDQMKEKVQGASAQGKAKAQKGKSLKEQIKDNEGQIDGVQRGKPKVDKASNSEIDGIQRGTPKQDRPSSETGEIDGIQRGEHEREKIKERMDDMKSDTEAQVEDQNLVKEDTKRAINKGAERMNERDWGKDKRELTKEAFQKARSEWADKRKERTALMRERVRNSGQSIEAAQNKIYKARERLNLKRESGEITEEVYLDRLQRLENIEKRLTVLNDKSMNELRRLDKVQEDVDALEKK